MTSSTQHHIPSDDIAKSTAAQPDLVSGMGNFDPIVTKGIIWIEFGITLRASPSQPLTLNPEKLVEIIRDALVDEAGRGYPLGDITDAKIEITNVEDRYDASLEEAVEGIVEYLARFHTGFPAVVRAGEGIVEVLFEEGGVSLPSRSEGYPVVARYWTKIS